MLNLIFYFQVHQPRRLRQYSVFDIGDSKNYFDDELNQKVINKVAEKCYLPTNNLLLKLIKKYNGNFKVTFSITGTFIEQLKHYRPDVFDSFKKLADSGSVEFLGETYYHSLAYLFDESEFFEQVHMHSDMMETEFNYKPTTFRNTELIYNNKLSDLIHQMPQFRVILTEGAEKILKWQSPLYAYQSYSQKHLLLLKHYWLSDDIAFRFSNKDWNQYPLTVDKFIKWVEMLPLVEHQKRNLFLNLFMDYETFGEHQWSDTGIFQFIECLPEYILKNNSIQFAKPCEIISSLNYPPATLSVEEPISWADSERDLSAWLSNPLQWNATKTFYKILAKIKSKQKKDLLQTARRLSTSDLYYYMCTKYFQDGDVHKYFSPYTSPEEAYVYFINVLADLENRIEEGIMV